MKTTITLVVLLIVTLVLSGCNNPTNSQDNIQAKKGGIRGLIFGDEVKANGTGSNQAPEALAADKSNTTIQKRQDGSNNTWIRDDRSNGESDSKRNRRESQSILD